MYGRFFGSGQDASPRSRSPLAEPLKAGEAAANGRRGIFAHPTRARGPVIFPSRHMRARLIVSPIIPSKIEIAEQYAHARARLEARSALNNRENNAKPSF